jgi:SAM-dependent methyltransferase
VRILFTVTLFLSSLLLFLIEPLIAKMILPRFGGSPGVWNASVLFFQAALLAGYGYAHLTTKWLGPRVQALTHVVVLLVPLIVLPFALPRWIDSGSGVPAIQVLLILAISVGLPFLVASAGAPLLQRWFAATDDPHAHDPYFLYSASNLASMLALLAYPFLIEPRLGLSQQTRLWEFGYIGLVVLMACCVGALWLTKGKGEPMHEAPATLPPSAEEDEPETVPSVDWKRRLLWIALAFCPSSLLLGVTTYLTSNIAPVPLLWVGPLALYLLTFIVAFAKRQFIPAKILGRILPLLVIPLAFTMVLEATDPKLMLPLVTLNLIVFFLASLLCHSQLAANRPKAVHLTEFYFYVSLGGVLGGLFNTLIAPSVFNSYIEYPLVLAAACLFRPSAQGWSIRKSDLLYAGAFAVLAPLLVFFGKSVTEHPGGIRSALIIGIPLVLVFVTVDRPFRFATTLFLFFVSSSVMQVAVGGRVVEAKRSFFGIHRVEEFGPKDELYRTLIHGNTIHGMENFGKDAGVPLTYYFPTGPIGEVFTILGPTRQNVALVGLGVGSLAAYGRPGQKMTFFEIDPDVVELARDSKLFGFLSRCKANLNIDVGDARLELAKRAPASFDLIVLDAFSSDSIPMHLLTQDAVRMYLTKLAPGGVIVFHVSNRYLALEPVVANVAGSLGLHTWLNDDQPDPDEMARGKQPSKWIVAARNVADFGDLRSKDESWIDLAPDPREPLWTDDYSNIVNILKLGRAAD